MGAVHVVRTPENVSFEFPLAGISSRGAAWIVDACVVAGSSVLLLLLLSTLRPLIGDMWSAVYLVAYFVVEWGYGTFFEWRFGGRTLGKRLFHLRTLSEDGLPLTMPQTALRNVLRLVDMLPLLYGTGALAATCDGRGRRLGDMAAGTVVVRDRGQSLEPRPSPDWEGLAGFRVNPTWAVSIKRLTPLERHALVALCSRREVLSADANQRLFRRMSILISTRLGLDKPCHCSDENYVLDVAKVVVSTETCLQTRGKSRTSEHSMGPQPGAASSHDSDLSQGVRTDGAER